MFRCLRTLCRVTALVTSLVLLSFAGHADHTPEPESVTIAGTIQSILGCPNDWAPECEATFLQYEPDSNIWRATFDLPAGSYEYKVALNGNWTENYGGSADQDGPNVSLVLDTDASVTFMYNHETHWVADNINHIVANVAGSFQSELGCPLSIGDEGDWAPECFRSWLQDVDGDGIYSFVTSAIPAGDYEAKVALDGSWMMNYGADGVQDGANIPFTVGEDNTETTFRFDTSSNVLTIAAGGPGGAASGEIAFSGEPRPMSIEQPDMVVVPGSLQSVLGCANDWDPACENTALTFSPDEDIWRGTFDLPAGTYEYKVAINGSWDENYGGSADPGGPNVTLLLDEDTTVSFYYDHFTHWIADSVNSTILTAPGSYQTELGCPTTMGAGGDWAPECFRSWLQDPDHDGVFALSTASLPAGDYEVKVAVNESWDLNYGADGTPGGANIPFNVPEDGVPVNFAYNSTDNTLSIGVGEPAVVGRVVTVDLSKARAHWVLDDTIVWNIVASPENTYSLFYSSDAELQIDGASITGGESIPLRIAPALMPTSVASKFPHLRGYTIFRIGNEYLERVPEILKSQIAVVARDTDGNILDATALQIPGVLDDLYTYHNELGVSFDDGVPTIRVWAPTARNVQFHLFPDSDAKTASTVSPMDYDAESGVWSITGEMDWLYQYYLYEVEVYAPSVGRVVTNMVTDPYSVSLSMNSTRTQIVDLNDPILMPEGWLETPKPPIEAPEDIVIYELHLRDFSTADPAVPEGLVGTFAAFTVEDSNGMQHLRNLADAGLTHIHLLPTFDIATINENAAARVEPSAEELASYPPDSDQQQAIINAIRDQDAFNWGYDPLHYTVPEGSYSTESDGAQRILEFRQMVQALNNAGLRVVVDVVYNHTNASGQSPNSVLDRIVPGYYHRLDENGNVATSTCCANTATEHNMMEKLMVDSVLTWAMAYRVDGFRFDLMGHHMVDNMEAVRDVLNSLTMDEHGIDGKAIYVYGEGWNFGEVADNAHGIHATQLNLPGTGIGTFNDRLRDAARGGSPFSGKQEQGFVNGLYTNANTVTPGTEEEQLQRLLQFSDQIRVGLAGNLRDYAFEGAGGTIVTGAAITYNGSPAGYTLDPQENIVYVAAHDNETLWDAIQYKAPETASVADRVRMNNLAVSLVGFSQGIPFFHAGDDLLRSKSMDRDSYNSGDWFNRLDFTYRANNWGAGLPPSSADNWDIIAPLLADLDLQAMPENITDAATHFQEVLKIRKSSPLFRLQTGEDVIERVSFHNTGPHQLPGLIVMSISDTPENDLDENYDMIVVVFNTRNETAEFGAEAISGMNLQLHPIQVASNDRVVTESSFDANTGIFSVPALTTAVFVLPENG